jgi:hypothetical protein
MQAPAPPEMMLLAKVSEALNGLAQKNPTLAPGLQKALAGIKEAQTAMVTQGPQQPPSATPPV